MWTEQAQYILIHISRAMQAQPETPKLVTESNIHNNANKIENYVNSCMFDQFK